MSERLPSGSTTSNSRTPRRFMAPITCNERPSNGCRSRRIVTKLDNRHTDCPWVLLYVERWLKASVQMEDGCIVTRTAGTPQGGVISPLLANLFLHYAFDMWMVREFPHIPFERYADDAICHCRSAEETRALWSALGDRLAACKLVLHPVKTKVVYCKDVNRRVRSSGSTFSGSSSEPGRRGAERRDAHLHAQLPACRQSKGADAHQPRSSRLGASQTQRQVPDRAGQDVQFVHSGLNHLLQP